MGAILIKLKMKSGRFNFQQDIMFILFNLASSWILNSFCTLFMGSHVYICVCFIFLGIFGVFLTFIRNF